MFMLIIRDYEGKEASIPLLADEITIGRKRGNTIRLNEKNVSRRHATIERHEGEYYLDDIDSYNGVLLNGSLINRRSSLMAGDVIQIADFTLEVVEADSVDEPASMIDESLIEDGTETQKISLLKSYLEGPDATPSPALDETQKLPAYKKTEELEAMKKPALLTIEDDSAHYDLEDDTPLPKPPSIMGKMLVALAVTALASVLGFWLLMPKEKTEQMMPEAESGEMETNSLNPEPPADGRRILEKASDNLDARQHYNLGVDLTRRRKYDKAIVEFKAALKQDDTLTHAWRELAAVYVKNDELEKAKQAYRRYLALAPFAQDAETIRTFLKEAGD